MKNNNSQVDGIDRREFMKTSSVAGLSAISIKALNSGLDPISQVQYVEMGLRYDVDTSIELEGFSLPYLHIDENVGHTIDRDEEKLYLLEPTPSAAVDTFKGSTAVVRLNGYRSVPTTVSGVASTEQVPINLGKSYRTTRALRLTQQYRHPRISVKTINTDVKVSSDSVDTRVVSDQSRIIRLPRVELLVELLKPTEELVDRPDIPEYKRAVKVEKRTETVEAVPELHVRNYGYLDVIDATGKRVIHSD